MSGVETIVNNSAIPLAVILTGRVGTPGQNGHPVSGAIPPHGSVTLQYGNDQNPFLNALSVTENSGGAQISQTFTATATGGPGTLDNLFNANSTVTLSYTPGSYSFGINASNAAAASH